MEIFSKKKSSAITNRFALFSAIPPRRLGPDHDLKHDGTASRQTRASILQAGHAVREPPPPRPQDAHASAPHRRHRQPETLSARSEAPESGSQGPHRYRRQRRVIEQLAIEN